MVRPWGWFTTVHSDNNATVKIIGVNPGESLSLQMHKKREEFWTLLDGPEPRLTIGDTTFWMEPVLRYHIPKKTIHRISNPHDQVLSVLEVSIGEFDEDDIVRLQDKYGRK